MRFYCHVCERVLKGRVDTKLDEYRLPRHKDPDGFWCWGSGQLAEEPVTEVLT